jgi:gliding motility-associated-like protein
LSWILFLDVLSFENTPSYIFNVIVTDDGEGNLSDIGAITVRLNDVIEAVLPANNYISPNNDGINDVFLIENVTLYQDFTLLIIDQYGNVVLKQDQYQNDWNGTDSSGRPLATGVYYYSMQGSGAPYKYEGSITLFRE